MSFLKSALGASAVLAAACTPVTPPAPDAGPVVVDAGTQDAGLWSASLHGTLAFTPQSAVAIFLGTEDAGLDPSQAGVLLSEVSHDEFCDSLNAGTTDKLPGRTAETVLFTSDGGALQPGTYYSEDGAAVVAGTYYRFPGDPGLLLLSRDGGVTLTGLELPKQLAGNIYGGGSASLSFDQNLSPEGDPAGAGGTLSGTVTATGCDYFPVVYASF